MAVEFNDQFFIDALNSRTMEAAVVAPGRKALAQAKANAPVDTGEYRDGLELQEGRVGDRFVVRVVGTDGKTLLVESQTGNLARALRSVKG